MGKTTRHFHVRAAEHLGISHLTGKRLAVPSESAIHDHFLSCSVGNFDDFEIIASADNNFRLCVKESLAIFNSRPKLNVNISSLPLKLFE